MIDSKIVLSKIIDESQIIKQRPIFFNEQSFQYFARSTSVLCKDKCLCIGTSKYMNRIDEYTKMVITNQEIFTKLKDKYTCGFCVTEQPRGLFFQSMNEYELSYGVNQRETTYGSGCEVSNNASISNCGVQIGSNVKIEDFVQIGPNVIIGDNTIIQAGAKIGVQGFNIYKYQGKQVQLFHNGKVIIGENVLIGPNNIIQQALYHYGITKIGDNSKFDGNVVVGHNTNIGQGCIITAGSCIAGYVMISDGAVLRLNSIIRNGITIGENAHIGMGSVVVRRVKKNSRMFGNPARDIEQL